MASNFDIAASITLKGEQEFWQSITGATCSLKEITSESKLVNEQFRGQQNTMEALRAQHEVLAKSVAAHKEKEEVIDRLTDKKESAKTLRYLMMVLLNDEAERSGKEGQKTYTEKEVGWLITQDNVLEVTVAVLKAYGLSLPEPDEFASPNGEGGQSG